MFLLSETAPPAFNVPLASSNRMDATDDALFPEFGDESSSRNNPLNDLKIGGVRYPFKTTLQARVLPTQDEEIEYQVEGFGTTFVGRGKTYECARLDWEEQVHTAFQHLRSTRPFEMNDEDQIRWHILETAIDVPQYVRTTPTQVRQVGRANYKKTDRPKRINWADGSGTDVALGDMPAAFAALKPNQWFEAHLERDPLTGELLRVLSIEPIPTLHLMTTEQQQKFLNSLPTDNSLHDAPNSFENDERESDDR